MNPKETLQPFDSFLKTQLRLQEKVHQPPKRDSDSENWKSWKVGMKVLVDFGGTYLTRGYEVKRGTIYEISEILTQVCKGLVLDIHLGPN